MRYVSFRDPGASENGGGSDPADLAEIEITPAGLGLHWPRLDADVYVPGLLSGAFGSRAWMAAQLGAQGGRAPETGQVRIGNPPLP